MVVGLFSNLLSTDTHCLIITLKCARYCWFSVRQCCTVHQH